MVGVIPSMVGVIPSMVGVVRGMVGPPGFASHGSRGPDRVVCPTPFRPPCDLGVPRVLGVLGVPRVLGVLGVPRY